MMTTENKKYYQVILIIVDTLGEGVEWYSKTFDTKDEAIEEGIRKENELYEIEEAKECKDIVMCIHRVHKTDTECNKEYGKPLEWFDMTEFQWD